MATKDLVETLKKVFRDKKRDGLVVDTIGLASAYHGLVKDRYTLAVSAPSLSGKTKLEKIQAITSLLFSDLTLDQRQLIDRVRVYDSVEELDNYRFNDFEEYPYDGYNGIQRRLPELYPVN
ncbi:hypothetical protein [Dyadobacter sp. MSC1_007]|jgi:stress-induced morphogen|uniref:hypothetical protein n=1 Tax=Dyadobacter sp. MSC1_007 TaxID=2909264 RepID=UPI00202EA0FA|nr:hypothetical protein [Dyadobacter sp. MSC1_007]